MARRGGEVRPPLRKDPAAPDRTLAAGPCGGATRYGAVMAARLAAYLSYRDAPAALAWLQAIGFDVVRRSDAPDGSVAHAEVRCDDVVLMVASYDADYRRPPLVGLSLIHI